MDNSPGFIPDGYCEAEMAIQAEVAAKYADELKEAGFWERRRIRQKIKEEVNERIAREAPPDALY